jgi:hypothetical protein
MVDTGLCGLLKIRSLVTVLHLELSTGLICRWLSACVVGCNGLRSSLRQRPWRRSSLTRLSAVVELGLQRRVKTIRPSRYPANPVRPYRPGVDAFSSANRLICKKPEYWCSVGVGHLGARRSPLASVIAICSILDESACVSMYASAHRSQVIRMQPPCPSADT